MSIHVITGNENKMRELKQVFPGNLNLEMTKLDLDEIQTLDTNEIIRHKLKQAYEIVHEPVIAEDISAELDCLNGLPGPFIKFFEQKMGMGSLYKLGYEGAKATLRCTMGYYDGTNELIIDSTLEGTITAPRGKEGFGFDFVFIPKGYSQTMSELGIELKNTISHRYLAATKLVHQLQINNIL